MTKYALIWVCVILAHDVAYGNGYIEPIYPLIPVIVHNNTRTPTMTYTPTGSPTLPECRGDFDHDGVVEIHEVVQSISNLLNGCD